MNTATALRGKVVMSIVVTIELLTLALYGGIFALIALGKGVPGEIWLAAGNSSGALITLLANTKHDGTQNVQVVNTEEDPVPVDAEAGHGDVNTIMLIAILVVVLLVLFGVNLNNR